MSVKFRNVWFFLGFLLLGLGCAASPKGEAPPKTGLLGPAPELEAPLKKTKTPKIEGEASKGDSPLNATARIKQAASRYHNTRAVRMAVKKRVFMALLERESLSEGQLYFSNGRLRLEIQKPEVSLIVADGNFMWLETQVSADMGGVQVARMRANTKRKKFKSPLAFLFNDLSVWDDFEVTKEKETKKFFEYELKPKANSGWSSLERLAIYVSKKKYIKKISYWDSLDNETSFEFSKIAFNAKVAKNKFKYSPPDGADVTEY